MQPKEHQATIGPFKSLGAAAEAGARDWLIERTKTARYAIVNPDIDGLLSYALLRSINSNLEIGGFYENEHQILVAERLADLFRAERAASFPSFLSIENDLLIMDSIGQHFCLLASPGVVRINPNMMRFGLAEHIGIERYTENFRSKYPFSTVFFLWVLLGRTSFTDKELIGLLYPDSAILKSFAQKYRENVDAWLQWMGVEHASRRFFELQGSSEVRQVARCLYRSQGSSQFSLVFQSGSGTAEITNLELARDVLRFFCGLLSIECPPLDAGIHVLRTWQYARFNAERQPDLRKRKSIFAKQLETNYATDGRLRSRQPGGEESTVRVLSEALVTHGEWSVTTNEHWWPIETDGIRIERRVVAGRNSELDMHISSLGLSDPCVATGLGCLFACADCNRT